MKLFNSAFIKLLISQAQVAFNDNATKLLLIGLVNMILPMDQAMKYISTISILLVAPYVLFSPLAGWLNDRFAKRSVIRWSLWVQIAVMVFLIASALGHNLPLIMVGFFLLATQAALYTPAKRIDCLFKEPERRLPMPVPTPKIAIRMPVALPAPTPSG